MKRFITNLLLLAAVALFAVSCSQEKKLPRIAIAGIKIESSTFSPARSTEASFNVAIGDEVFEASTMYNKVIGWKITDIKLEKYIGGWKTIVRLENTYNFFGTTTKFLSDVLDMFETKEDAEKALSGETIPNIDEISNVI